MRISDWSSDVCSSDLPHRRVSIKASGTQNAAQTGRTYESNRSKPSRPQSPCHRGRPHMNQKTAQKRIPFESAKCHPALTPRPANDRSEENTSELQSLMRISYAVFCLKKQLYSKHHNKHIKYTY